MSPTVVRCSCGCLYTAEQFAALPFVGVQWLDPSDPALILRNCTCLSTLGLEVDGETLAVDAVMSDESLLSMRLKPRRCALCGKRSPMASPCPLCARVVCRACGEIPYESCCDVEAAVAS